MRATRLSDVLKGPPEAWADLKKTRRAPHLQGKIQFYSWSRGVLIKSEFVNLPEHTRYQLKMRPGRDGREPPIRHMPSFYPEHGYAFFLFYSDQIRVDDLLGEELALTFSNKHPDGTELISSGVIQSKKSQQ